jgi:hypothetical protein
MSNGPLFRAEYRDPDNKGVHQVPVIAVDMPNKLALILHQRGLLVVSFDQITHSRWHDD